MAITKRPDASKQASDAEKFIAGAPDASHVPGASPGRRRKEVISPSVDVDLLKRFDTLAAELGLSRAAAINLAMAKFIASQ
ncbi:hypothetical protein B0G62_12244 [Paraburkholderia eburnea]|uniref:Ribbon-helix-helix CopG family protein n=1 Tax=Paraburkholderia eburnea TaxID=1189126 RepID=A0A2S4LW95_9BURK|nr:CopG family transcriptional regulator [Paraburkholderia eburnea]POR46728.1 hypothetical protein B0G62_12244 [Paraburkholderia eburnea]PRZ17917.1 hypothetical protein BX588_12244 [Paraburkholderia eburnea]